MEALGSPLCVIPLLLLVQHPIEGLQLTLERSSEGLHQQCAQVGRIAIRLHPGLIEGSEPLHTTGQPASCQPPGIKIRLQTSSEASFGLQQHLATIGWQHFSSQLINPIAVGALQTCLTHLHPQQTWLIQHERAGHGQGLQAQGALSGQISVQPFPATLRSERQLQAIQGQALGSPAVGGGSPLQHQLPVLTLQGHLGRQPIPPQISA